MMLSRTPTIRSIGEMKGCIWEPIQDTIIPAPKKIAAKPNVTPNPYLTPSKAFSIFFSDVEVFLLLIKCAKKTGSIA